MMSGATAPAMAQGAPVSAPAAKSAYDFSFEGLTGGAVPLVGVGGIATAEHAWERIRAGASLVQLYSAMVFAGPGLGGRIVRGLDALMRRDGFASIAEAVGSE
jgi:dihydroorotate dehydrogenase